PPHLRKRPHADDYSHYHPQGNEYLVSNQESPVTIVRCNPSFSAVRNVPQPVYTIQQPPSVVPISSPTPSLHYNTSYSSAGSLHLLSETSELDPRFPLQEPQPTTIPIDRHSIKKLANASMLKSSSKKKKQPTGNDIIGRIKGAQAAFGGTSGWCQLYKTIPLGSLPTLE
ncbi:hypothetical protein BGZ76_007309, partial [Entomortierella beljakovae]